MTTHVYRYFHAGNSDHFYTTNAAEIGTTTHGQAGNHGYTSEGEAFHVYPEAHPGLVPVYRYYNGGSHDHFYTTNADEIGATNPGQAGNHGYVCEGILGYLSPHDFPGSVPVYRYYNEGSHDHFYTTNAGEIGTTTHGHAGNHGFKSEGVLGYAYHHLVAVHRYYHEGHHDHFYTSNAGEIGTTTHGQTGNHGYKSEGFLIHLSEEAFPGSAPVYRYYNGATHDHFYTTNAGEIGTTTPGQTGNSGYTFEGVVGHAAPGGGHGLVAIYRYWNAGTSDHFYTTNAGEIGTTTPGHAGNHGYTCEGVLGYGFP